MNGRMRSTPAWQGVPDNIPGSVTSLQVAPKFDIFACSKRKKKNSEYFLSQGSYTYGNNYEHKKKSVKIISRRQKKKTNENAKRLERTLSMNICGFISRGLGLVATLRITSAALVTFLRRSQAKSTPSMFFVCGSETKLILSETATAFTVPDGFFSPPILFSLISSPLLRFIRILLFDDDVE